MRVCRGCTSRGGWGQGRNGKDGEGMEEEREGVDGVC